MKLKQRNVFSRGLLMLCLLLLMPIFSAGCWDRHEPSFLGVVTVIAFDYDPETGLLQVITQVANPLVMGASDSKGGSSGGGGGNPFWVVETSGHTILEAIKKTEQFSTRRLLWSHMEAVLFTEALARKGLRPVLDYFDRERQSRLIARPFVVQGNRGDLRRLMTGGFPLEQLGGPALTRQLATIRMEDAYVPEVDSLRLLFHHLSTPGVELIMPRIEVQVEKKEEGEGQGNGNGEAQAGKPNPAKISGAALFRGDKLAGFFNEKEVAGYLWLTHNIRNLTMVFPSPGEKENEENNFLTVEIFWAAAKISPEVEDEKVRMHISIQAEGKLQDYAGQSLPQSEAFKNSLNRRMATVIHNQIGAAWQKARELKLDVFGFGREIYKTRPRDWKRLENKWEEIFPEIELEVDVYATMRSYGLVFDPVKIR